MKTEINTQLTASSPVLRRFAFKLTGDEQDAKDLYQETALRIFVNAEKFKKNTNFEAWAKVIMRNLFINQYRRKIRQNTYTDNTPEQSQLIGPHHALTSRSEVGLYYQELIKMVQGLPENLRGPFIMSYHGYKYEEIADLLDTPMGTIKSRIFMARKKLRQQAHILGF